MKNLFIIIAALAITSCSTTKSGTSKTMDIAGPGVFHKPVIVDLDVAQVKSEKTVSLRNVTSLDAAKNEVVRDLLFEKKADILVEPSFFSTTKNGKTELTVYGWTANYKNFRPIEDEDIKFMEIKPNLLQKADVYQPVTAKKKSNAGWIIAGAVVVGGLAILGGGL